MTLSRRYDPAVHDAMLWSKWKRGLDDYEIRYDFIRQGLNFPYHVIREARQRLKLKPNARAERVYATEKDGPLPSGRPDPLAVAQTWLPGFDRETMTVNGRGIGLDEMAKRTNAILKREGLPLLDAKSEWTE